ncbi:hypothetical protein GP486_000695 [Trichoglossum hirsutum]|uniref:A-kinase anchor protein 7-like phosphoesterase domain-containing protein n=1 Tax=Trichoglossum hirsutum TaxID=265104 RepID=A0A9P8LHB9_9PEZI|nr:hypothetical protein GP486_000695 [Trichoglossum hirsutum]
MPPGKPPRAPLTHFLCLPLVTSESRPQLRASLQQFSADILTPRSDRQYAIPEKAIRPLDTLHLTIGVMSLQEPEKLDRAQKHLESIDLRSLLRTASVTALERDAPPLQVPTDTAPLTISLKSVVTMHPPTSASVLHSIPVDTTNRLGPFCQLLRDSFQREGLIEDEGRPLLLHATVLNTTYASGRAGRRDSAKGKITFDASEIISRYEGFMFVKDMRVENVAICRMGARKIVDEETGCATEKYEVVQEVSLP